MDSPSLFLPKMVACMALSGRPESQNSRSQRIVRVQLPRGLHLICPCRGLAGVWPLDSNSRLRTGRHPSPKTHYRCQLSNANTISRLLDRGSMETPRLVLSEASLASSNGPSTTASLRKKVNTWTHSGRGTWFRACESCPVTRLGQLQPLLRGMRWDVGIPQHRGIRGRSDVSGP